MLCGGGGHHSSELLVSYFELIIWQQQQRDHFTAPCPRPPGWAGTRRNTHSPSILTTIQSPSAVSRLLASLHVTVADSGCDRGHELPCSGHRCLCEDFFCKLWQSLGNELNERSENISVSLLVVEYSVCFWCVRAVKRSTLPALQWSTQLRQV